MPICADAPAEQCKKSDSRVSAIALCLAEVMGKEVITVGLAITRLESSEKMRKRRGEIPQFVKKYFPTMA